MNRKKIAWITFNAFLDTDLYVIRELKKYYDINWYILKSGNEKVDYSAEVAQMQEDADLHVEIIECGRRLRMPECIFSYRKLLKTIRRSHCDLVYSCLAGAPYFVPMLAHHIHPKKILFGIHNVHVPKGGSAYWFFKLYNGYAIRTFRNFQTFSQSQCAYLKSLVPEKTVEYTPFLLKDFGQANICREDSRITFLNFGNIRPYKRIDVLIQAAQAAYEKTQKPFKVILAGKCDNWDAYEALITHKELFDLRIYRVENSEIPNLFAEADYFVAPYQDIAQSGSTMVAVNYEKPVIASRLPAFEEYIEQEKNGFLIPPADKEALTQVFVRILMEHAAIYPAMQQNQKEIKETCFGTEAVVNRYREIIDAAIRNSQKS